ncbi:MAG: prolyl oligopeptidase family serine peptidase [Pseudomonadota bacterium]
MHTPRGIGRARSSPEYRRRLLSLVACAIAAVWLATSEAAEPGQLSLERLFAAPNLAGTAPTQPVWSPDSTQLAFLWSDAGTRQRALWLVRSTGEGLRRVEAPAAAAKAGVSQVLWSKDGERLITLRGRTLWSTHLVTGKHTLLAHVAEGASDLAMSPDGTRLTWLQAGDLWQYDDATQTVDALTALGLPPLSSLAAGRYSRREREIGPGIWSGPTYAWSPDGRYVALHVVDRREMRKVPFPNYLAAETDPNLVRRGYPGDPNEARALGLLDVSTGALRWPALPTPTANQIIDFTWSSQGVLLVDVASDTAVDRWLYTVVPGEETPQVRWHSYRPSRIYTAFAAAWGPEGERPVFLSDIEDRYGLFTLDAGSVPTAERLTDPAYDVLSAPRILASGEIYFTGNGEGPYDQHVYRFSPATGETARLTHVPGRHVAYPSPDGHHLATVHSADDQPTELFIARRDGGKRTRVTHSPTPEFDTIAWGTPRYVSFPSSHDEQALHARLLLPPDFDASRRYPVLFGPVYSNTVRNRWAGTYGLVQHVLAQRGYVVVQVDVRGSTGYGRDFREAFLADFAGEDIDDLASAVHYLKALPYIDGERMGVWGSSYGGTLTVYSLLTRPGLFCAGVAAAAAVDPDFFGTDDVAIVRRPDTHPEIFARKAKRHVAKLEDHLLLIHGMQDHVVPFKTTAVLADELIKAGKDFDFAFAPGATHGWSREGPYARYLFGKLVAHFDRYVMKGEGACSNGV